MIKLESFDHPSLLEHARVATWYYLPQGLLAQNEVDWFESANSSILIFYINDLMHALN